MAFISKQLRILAKLNVWGYHWNIEKDISFLESFPTADFLKSQIAIEKRHIFQMNMLNNVMPWSLLNILRMSSSNRFFRFEYYRWYQIIAYTIFILLPMVLITVISAVTIHALYWRKDILEKKNRSKAKERTAALQLFLVVISFFIGYLPFTGKFECSVWGHP